MSNAGEAVVLDRNGKADEAKKLVLSFAWAEEDLNKGLAKLGAAIKALGDNQRLQVAAFNVGAAATGPGGRALFHGSPEGYSREFFRKYKLLVSARDEDLWSHPHPRYLSRMVYLPEQKAILLWGGTDGHQHLNDTWLYDCTKREWARKSPKTRPRPREMHVLVYNSKLKKAVMAGGYTSWWAYPRDELREVWTYDAVADDWQLVLKDFPFKRGQPSYFGEYDEANDAIIVAGHGTWALKLEPGGPLEAPKTAARPVPEDRAPFIPPRDDPKVLERWKSLPANTWVSADPNWEPGDRGWGMMGWNGRLHCVIHWGGGHSTYQANDICLYFPGANKWVRPYPAHRINMAPWNKGCGNPGGVDLRGGVHNLHARRGLGGNGGKILITMSTFSPYWYGPGAFLKQPTSWGKLTTFEFDLFSRRWRLPCPARIASGMNYPYNAKKTVMAVDGNGAYYYDFAKDNWLAASAVRCPAPVQTGEGAGSLFIEKRNLVVVIGPTGAGKPIETWALDIAKGRWQKLGQGTHPPGVRPTALAFVDRGKGYIYAGCFRGFDLKLSGRNGAEAVYSFEHDRWIVMPTKVVNRVRKRGEPYRPPGIGGFHCAWSKIAYSPKHDLLIDYSTGTWVMRPEFGRLER